MVSSQKTYGWTMYYSIYSLNCEIPYIDSMRKTKMVVLQHYLHRKVIDYSYNNVKYLVGK